MSSTVTNDTLVDTCVFPSNRFGTTYTSRLANDVVSDVSDGVQVIHPDSSAVTETETVAGATVTNTVESAIDSGLTELTETAAGATVTTAQKVVETSEGATVTSDIQSIASAYHVTYTAEGATVVGKQC